MARPRSDKVKDVKAKLIARLNDATRPPGTRFLSARAVATLYSISYQTAHRLLSELAVEQHLTRRAASGTFRPGSPPRQLVGAQLLFHERAQRPDSFGAHLLRVVRERLARDRVDVRITFCNDSVAARLSSDRLPILWEAGSALDRCVAAGRPALLLNDRPPPGIDSLRVDSVGVDDFSGGVCAGQLLLSRVANRRSKQTYVIVAGPADDRRSVARVAGCKSVLGEGVAVVYSNSWFFQDGLAVAEKALRAKPAGIFCCNDRLAEAVCARAKEPDGGHLPALVGFDDGPVAEVIRLTTIAIPWSEVVDSVAVVVRRRLGGDRGAASHQVVSPQPVVRWPIIGSRM